LTVLGNVSVSNKLTVQGFRISSSPSSGLQAVTDGDDGENITSNPIVITNATNSTSTSTGALTLDGGLGVDLDIYGGGSMTLSGDLTVDTNTLKVDASQNRVGILTASPGYPLDVHGAANVGALTTTFVSGDGSGLTGLNADNISSGTLDDARLPSTINGERTFSSSLQVGTANLFVDTTTGNVGVGTVTPGAKLGVNGTLHAPGVPVQFVSAQVHDKVAYSTAETTHISPLDISITPHFSNSKIYLMWRIEYEVHHDANFRIYRDGTLIGYNTVSGDVQWSGVTTATYDQNVDSTPEQSMITWIDEPNTTSTVTYKVYMKRSGNSNWPFYLNRPSVSSGASAQETGVSQKTAMEIAQ